MRLHITKEGVVSSASGIQALRKNGRIIKRTKKTIVVQWPTQEPGPFQGKLAASQDMYKISEREYNPRSGLETLDGVTTLVKNSLSTKVEFDAAIQVLLDSAEGRKALAEKVHKMGLVKTDKQKLAFLFFTDPKFAKEISDRVWKAGQGHTSKLGSLKAPSVSQSKGRKSKPLTQESLNRGRG